MYSNFQDQAILPGEHWASLFSSTPPPQYLSSYNQAKPRAALFPLLYVLPRAPSCSLVTLGKWLHVLGPQLVYEMRTLMAATFKGDCEDQMCWHLKRLGQRLALKSYLLYCQHLSPSCSWICTSLAPEWSIMGQRGAQWVTGCDLPRPPSGCLNTTSPKLGKPCSRSWMTFRGHGPLWNSLGRSGWLWATHSGSLQGELFKLWRGPEQISWSVT